MCKLASSLYLSVFWLWSFLEAGSVALHFETRLHLGYIPDVTGDIIYIYIFIIITVYILQQYD